MKNRYYPQVTPLKVGKSLQRIDSLVLYLINVNFKKRGRERERVKERDRKNISEVSCFYTVTLVVLCCVKKMLHFKMLIMQISLAGGTLR